MAEQRFAAFVRELHLALFKDGAALALDIGHTDSGMTFAHYWQLVRPAEAEPYWSIQPQADERKIIDIA